MACSSRDDDDLFVCLYSAALTSPIEYQRNNVGTGTPIPCSSSSSSSSRPRGSRIPQPMQSHPPSSSGTFPEVFGTCPFEVVSNEPRVALSPTTLGLSRPRSGFPSPVTSHPKPLSPGQFSPRVSPAAWPPLSEQNHRRKETDRVSTCSSASEHSAHSNGVRTRLPGGIALGVSSRTTPALLAFTNLYTG